MTIDWDLIVRIGVPIVCLFIGALLDRWLENKPKITTYFGHVAALTARPQGMAPFQVHTHSVVIRNAGRKAATNLRLGHTVLPDFNVYPQTNYQVENLPDGGKEIVFPTFAPKQEVIVSYLYFPPMIATQINTHLRSDEGPARMITMLLTPQLPKWKLRTLLYLIIMGIISTIYVIVILIRWVAT